METFDELFERIAAIIGMIAFVYDIILIERIARKIYKEEIINGKK